MTTRLRKSDLTKALSDAGVEMYCVARRLLRLREYGWSELAMASRAAFAAAGVPRETDELSPHQCVPDVAISYLCRYCYSRLRTPTAEEQARPMTPVPTATNRRRCMCTVSGCDSSWRKARWDAVLWCQHCGQARCEKHRNVPGRACCTSDNSVLRQLLPAEPEVSR